MFFTMKATVACQLWHATSTFYNLKEELLMRKQLVSFVFLFVFMLAVQLPAAAADTMWNSIEKRLVTIAPTPKYGHEWLVFTLARGGYDNDAYYAQYVANVANTLQQKDGVLHEYKYTEYARVILALNASGADATTIGGYNLYEKLTKLDDVATQGVNGPVFALLAFDSKDYALSNDVRQQFVQYIVQNQLPSGSFTLDDETDNVDMTAMALQALAPYKDDAAVKAAIDKALMYLQRAVATEQLSSESYAQVIVALSALQLDVQKGDFASVLPRFFAFYESGQGGFKHVLTDDAIDNMATEQGAYAYVALNRFRNGEAPLYDMTDKTDVIPFTDTVTHWVHDMAIVAQQRGIMNGYADGTFKPSQSLTRVQAVSILARVLDLPNTNETLVYRDMPNYAEATKKLVQQAYEAGLVQRNGGQFNPSAKVTRAQLALMMARAYTYKTGEAITAAPTTFSDTASFAIEAQRAIQFLADANIVNTAATFNPSYSTTRAHAAKMFVHFMDVIAK